MTDSDLDTSSVQSRKDFIAFVERLVVDYERHNDSWENRDVDAYLIAMASWLKDADGYYRNVGSSINSAVSSWKLFADALLAARIYE